MRETGSNKNFGIVFFIVFILIAVWPLIDGQSLRVWSLIVSLIFLVLGLLNSKLLNPLNLAWVKFGKILGKVVAPIKKGDHVHVHNVKTKKW